MLIKVENGMSARMIHKGVRYYFAEKEIKDCPPSMLSAFRGVLVSAEPQQTEPSRIIKMPIIQVRQEKIIIKKTGKKKKK